LNCIRRQILCLVLLWPLFVRAASLGAPERGSAAPDAGISHLSPELRTGIEQSIAQLSLLSGPPNERFYGGMTTLAASTRPADKILLAAAARPEILAKLTPLLSPSGAAGLSQIAATLQRGAGTNLAFQQMVDMAQTLDLSSLSSEAASARGSENFDQKFDANAPLNIEPISAPRSKRRGALLATTARASVRKGISTIASTTVDQVAATVAGATVIVAPIALIFERNTLPYSALIGIIACISAVFYGLSRLHRFSSDAGHNWKKSFIITASAGAGIVGALAWVEHSAFSLYTFATIGIFAAAVLAGTFLTYLIERIFDLSTDHLDLWGSTMTLMFMVYSAVFWALGFMGPEGLFENTLGPVMLVNGLLMVSAVSLLLRARLRNRR
jgi:hypothetical protein